MSNEISYGNPIICGLCGAFIAADHFDQHICDRPVSAMRASELRALIAEVVRAVLEEQKS